MSDDLDFDMEVVGDDELGEMGGDDASGIVEDSHLEREGSEDATNSSESDELTPEESSPTINPDVVGWLQINLGELASFQNGNAFSKSDWGEEGYPIIRIQNLTGEADEYNHYDGELEARYRVEPGDTLLTWSGTIGAFSWKGPPAALNQHIFKVETGSEVNDSFFQFKLEELIPQLEALSHGSTMKHVRKADLVNIDIELPPLPEQRKIASVLYAVDQAIQKTEAIIEQAKRVKRGLMQDLFGKAGNSHSGRGGKEFWIGPKKFEVPEHWEKTKIREIGRVVTGDTPSTDDENNFGGSLPFVTPSDLKRTKYVVETDRTLSAQGRGQAKPIPEGSVMMDCIGSDMGKVAIAGREVATNQQINSVVVTDDEYNAEFLYYHLLILSGYIKAQAGRTATPIVNKGDFQTFGLLKPPLEEQQRIAKSLATYDEVDSTNRGYLERLTSLKKGLMQDLLTGEFRTANKAVEILDEVAAHG